MSKRTEYEAIVEVFRLAKKRYSQPEAYIFGICGTCQMLCKAGYVSPWKGSIIEDFLMRDFTPDKFGIQYLWFGSPFLGSEKVFIEDEIWYRIEIKKVPEEQRRSYYWFPLTKESLKDRIKILDAVIETYENLIKEGENVQKED